MAAFIISSDYQELIAGRRCLVVRPASDSKRELLHWYAQQLQFPGYFGYNWDALEECLCDLSWLTARRLLLVHQQVPLRGRAALADRKTYLQVLANAVQRWRGDARRELLVVFAARCQEPIRRALLC